ncbi:MAG: site-specific integrase [Candidatus Bathyarchaeia archaeon]
MRWRRFGYSVSLKDVECFVRENGCVGDFLAKYDWGSQTWLEKAVGLCRFFRWLEVVKGLRLRPKEFLDLHLRKRSAESVEDRRWALRLALEYSRDNPDLRDKALHYRYSAWFLPVKLFCDYHEAPLTSVNGFFRKRNRRKYEDKPFTVDFVKQILGVLSQRDLAVCMVMLQSGQSVEQVLVDVNRQAKYVISQINMGKERIRLDFPERKGNGFRYFSFISKDAIQEIRKWLPIRRKWLEEAGIKDSEWLFITDAGKPLTPKLFHNRFRQAMIRHKLREGPYSVRPHCFRKFFEQEASPPERGINKAYISFMMGHSTGDGFTHKLDAVGGVYDKAPWIYEKAVEQEYCKLEPFINIFSGRSAEPIGISEQDVETLKQLLEMMKEGKIKIVSL